MEAQTQTPETVTNLAPIPAARYDELRPPYRGTYERVWASSSYFWWHLVKKPQVGEVVVQLGTRPASHPFVLAKATAGLKHIYPSWATGLYNVSIDINPGPITRRAGARVSACAWVQGVGGTFRAVPVFSWRRTSIEIPNVLLRYGYAYTIVVAGEVLNPAPPGREPYGEFIGTFPRIRITPPYSAATALEQEEVSNLDAAIAEHSSLEEMCKALKSSSSDIYAHTEDLSDQQLEAAEGMEFVTSTKNDA